MTAEISDAVRPVLPGHLRRPFYRDRRLLTGLCRSAVEATHTFDQAGLGRDDLRVGDGSGSPAVR